MTRSVRELPRMRRSAVPETRASRCSPALLRCVTWERPGSRMSH